MTASPEERKPKDPSIWMGPTRDRFASLTDYFLAGAERYTPEALRQAARESGFSPDEIDAAYARATTRQRDEELSRPIRTRARWIMLAAYGLVYAILAVRFLGMENRYGAATVALVILTVALLIALLISSVSVNRRAAAGSLEWALMTLLAVPFVLLVVVAGLCIVTTDPFGEAAL